MVDLYPWLQSVLPDSDVKIETIGITIGRKPSKNDISIVSLIKNNAFKVRKEYNMSQDFIFQSSQTRKLSIKVYVPDDGGGEMSAGLSGSNYICVGLLVEHQPGIITGFNR